MSYEIIKRIRIEGDKVFLTSASNNVHPRDYTEWECKSLGEILKNQGREALDLEIFREYESGNFQSYGMANKYKRALLVLRNMPEYPYYDWRGPGPIGSNGDRNSSAFTALLLRALKTPLPKDRFLIARPNGCERAKIFRYKAEAESLKKCFVGGHLWQVQAA